MALKRPMPHAHDYDVDKYKYDYLPLQAYGGWYAIAQDSDATVAAEDLVISAGTGSPSYGEVTDAGIVGLHVDDTGDSVGILYPVPYDMDINSPMDFAVAWTSDTSTTTESITPKVLYTELTVDSEAIEAGASALDTAIAADTQAGTVQAIQVSAWGTINGGTLTAGNWLALDVSYSAESGIDASSDAVHMLYLIIRYVRRAL